MEYILQIQTHFRLMQAWLCLLVAAFALLVGLNNLLDYNSNFMFVQHVLSMDTTFEGNSLMWRAIETPAIHHLAYWGIILAEFATGVLCLTGAVLMMRSLKQNPEKFNPAKTIAAWGLVLGLSLWFGGFMVVGAEWFLMWQSQIWNGQAAATRFITALFFTLVFLYLPEPKQ